MAMAVGERDEGEPLSEINTTPLIDVMLVLLIMMIVTLPPQRHAVKLDTPLPPPPNQPLSPYRTAAGVDELNGVKNPLSNVLLKTTVAWADPASASVTTIADVVLLMSLSPSGLPRNLRLARVACRAMKV